MYWRHTLSNVWRVGGSNTLRPRPGHAVVKFNFDNFGHHQHGVIVTLAGLCCVVMIVLIGNQCALGLLLMKSQFNHHSHSNHVNTIDNETAKLGNWLCKLHSSNQFLTVFGDFSNFFFFLLMLNWERQTEILVFLSLIFPYFFVYYFFSNRF